VASAGRDTTVLLWDATGLRTKAAMKNEERRMKNEDW
jgi:hypothetical protein